MILRSKIYRLKKYSKKKLQTLEHLKDLNRLSLYKSLTALFYILFSCLLIIYYTFFPLYTWQIKRIKTWQVTWITTECLTLTSIRKVHPSRLSSLRVVFLARAWHNNLEGWSSRASRGLDRSNSWRQGASVRASTNGITSAGLDAPAALRASKLRAFLMVSPKQPASRPPRRHLDTFRDLSLQFGSLKHKAQRCRSVGLYREENEKNFHLNPLQHGTSTYRRRKFQHIQLNEPTKLKNW